jgi:L-arabinose isomerase
MGYGFAGEGDWKTAALVRAMKVMGSGCPGVILLWKIILTILIRLIQWCLALICSRSVRRLRMENLPAKYTAWYWGKADPVRLVFNSAAGPALNASLVDMGNRFRLIVNEVEAVAPLHDLPKLPVARVLWKPLPDMKTGCAHGSMPAERTIRV